jgi:RNA polymerase sigma-70 factor (ECF subfamily)
MSQQLEANLDQRWAETLARLDAFVAARVGDRETAADITQDVLVRSIASGALQHVDNPTAWLYRSARNAVIDHYRTRRTHDSTDQLDQWPSGETSADEPNEATRELAYCLRPLLEQLPEPARDALTRVDLEGATHREAANTLGISVSGMKSRVQRARRDLRDLLERCCAVEVDTVGAVADYQPNKSSCGCSEGPLPCR